MTRCEEYETCISVGASVSVYLTEDAPEGLGKFEAGVAVNMNGEI